MPRSHRRGQTYLELPCADYSTPVLTEQTQFTEASSRRTSPYRIVVHSHPISKTPRTVWQGSVVMHQGPHGLGENSNPVMVHLVQIIDCNKDGSIAALQSIWS